TSLPLRSALALIAGLAAARALTALAAGGRPTSTARSTLRSAKGTLERVAAAFELACGALPFAGGRRIIAELVQGVLGRLPALRAGAVARLATRLTQLTWVRRSTRVGACARRHCIGGIRKTARHA